jgi:tetratricopeptide (TPR) repeat protein
MIRTAVLAFLTLSILSIHTAAQNAGKAAEIYNQALELQQAGDSQRALAAYDRAIALNPTMLDAYNNRATMKLAAGDSAGSDRGPDQGHRVISQTPAQFLQSRLHLPGYAKHGCGDS